MTALQAVYVAFPDLFAHDLDHVSERLYLLSHLGQVHSKRADGGLYYFAYRIA